MPENREVIEQVREDIEVSFAGVLERRGDGLTTNLNQEDPMPALVSDEVGFAAVPWEFPCTHVGMFLGIPPTFLDLVLRGATFVDIREDDPARWGYYRYIDYHGALNQIGVTGIERPALSDEDYLRWVDDPRRVPAGDRDMPAH